MALPRQPYARDSAVAMERVLKIRAEIAKGAKFEDVAKRESADTASGSRGGDLEWIKRDEAGFDPQFMEGVRRLAPGALSRPVLTNYGYHLIRVDAAKGDSLHVRHILIPIELTGDHLDYVEARADTLDKLAAEQYRRDGARRRRAKIGTAASHTRAWSKAIA